MDNVLINGGVYNTPFGRKIIIFIGSEWIEKDLVSFWGMLSINRHYIAGMSCPGFQHNAKGEFQFTLKDLKEQYGFDEWVLLNGRLRVELIDTMNCVEFPIVGSVSLADLKPMPQETMESIVANENRFAGAKKGMA